MANSGNGNSKAQGNKRGFAAMAERDPEELSKIASKGGKTAHKRGTAREFNQQEAKEAGRRGGQKRAENMRKAQQGGSDESGNNQENE